MDYTQILGYAEWFFLAAIGVELLIAAVKVGLEHNLGEGFRKLFWATAGTALALGIINIVAPSVASSAQNMLASLPAGAGSIVATLLAGAVGIGVLYGAYTLARQDLERGLEILFVSMAMAVLVLSAGAIVSGTAPGGGNYNPPNIDQSSNGISLNFLSWLPYYASWVPAAQSLPVDITRFAEYFAMIGIAVLAVWRFLFDFETDLPNYLLSITKDIVIAGIVISSSVVLWNAFADALNGLIATIINQPSVQQFLVAYAGSLLAWIVGGIAGGYFVPFLADYAAELVLLTIITFDMLLARYLILAAIATAAPLLAGLYLIPPLRGVVKFFAEFAFGLAIGGVIAAIALYVLANSPASGYVLVTGPIALGILPWFTGLATSVGGAMGGSIIRLPSRSSSSSTASSSSSGGGGQTTLRNTAQAVGLHKYLPRQKIPTVPVGQSSSYNPPAQPITPQQQVTAPQPLTLSSFLQRMQQPTGSLQPSTPPKLQLLPAGNNLRLETARKETAKEYFSRVAKTVANNYKIFGVLTGIKLAQGFGLNVGTGLAQPKPTPKQTKLNGPTK